MPIMTRLPSVTAAMLGPALGPLALTQLPTTIPKPASPVVPAPAPKPATTPTQTTAPKPVVTPTPAPAPKQPAMSAPVNSTPTYQKPTQAELNRQLDTTKQEWWDARFRNDQKAMEAAKAKGNTLRQAGAVETEAAKKRDIENAAKWETQKQNELNANLFNFKKQWWDAYDSGNQQAMNEAKARGEMYRSQGAVETDEMKRYDAERLKQSEVQKAEKTRLAELQRQNELNAQLLQAKVQWWEARLQSGGHASEVAHLEAIKKNGDELRARGARETSDSAAVDRSYQALLDTKLAGEKALLQEKKNWWNAYLNLDQAGMNKAAAAADNLRSQRYVKETADMSRLESQNLQFLRAKQDYYAHQMNLNTAGMSEAKSRMDRSTLSGGSLSSQAVYGLDTANRTIISHRVAYWNTYAAQGWNQAEQHKYAEQTFRNAHAFQSMLIGDNRNTAFDQAANNVLWKTADRWNLYATMSRNDLVSYEAQHSGGLASALTAKDAELQKLYQSMHTALSGYGVFRETRADVVNKELELVRKRYWSAVDTGNNTLSNSEQTQIDKLLRANQGLDGLLVSTKRDANNRAFLQLREGMNADLSRGLYDTVISKITQLQSMLAGSGSDLNIRRNASVSVARADGLLLHIKAKEWSNAENLVADAGGALSKVKATVKDRLGVSQAGINASVAMDNANRQVLAAKRDFWAGITNGVSTAQLEQAYRNISTAASNRNATLGASLNTAFNSIFRDAIEYKIRSWTEKGNAATQNAVYALGTSVNALAAKANNLGLADSVKGFSFGAGAGGSTKLDKQLSELYQYKKTIWDMNAGVIKPNDNARLPANPKQAVESLLAVANKYIAKDIALPAFAMDAANERVIQARDKVMEAVAEGIPMKADYYLREGRNSLSQGATLDIDQLVGDLNKLMNRSEADKMNEAIEQRIRQVNATIPAKDMTALQESLTKMNIYAGPITGRYDKATFVAVFAYQKLLESDTRATMFKQQGVNLGQEGTVTTELIKFAITDTALGRKNSPAGDLSILREKVTYFGIADGMVTQLASDAQGMLEAAASLNPMSAAFWTKTVPQLGELVKGIASGEITMSSVFGAMAGAVKQEYVEPFQYIKNNHTKVLSGVASYEEARTFGKNLTKAIEAIAGAVSLGAYTAAKAAPKVKELISGLQKAVTDSPADAKKLENEVLVGGRASFSPKLEDHIKYIDPAVPRSRGIGGAHNKEEFYKNDVNVLNVEKHPSMPGVEKVTYQIPSIDGKTGDITGWKAKEYVKTIYDPKVISDEEYIKLGKEAANNALSKGELGREWEGHDSNGVKWMGYADSDGTVTSFFPEF